MISNTMIIWSVVAVVGSVGLAVLFNILIIKHYPEESRKLKYVATVVVFLLIAIVLCGLKIGNSIVTTVITEQSENLKQLIIKSSPNSSLVQNGYDLNKAPQVDVIVSDIRKLMPSYADLGINKAIYDMVMDYAMNELYKKLKIIDITVKQAGSFADENNKLTVSSLVGGLRDKVINVVNIICLVFAGIFVILWLIYVITTLVTAGKAKKNAQVSAPPTPAETTA